MAEPRWKRFLATNLFGLTFGLSVLFLGAFLLVPILQTLAGGSIFGADWAEYLYTGPIYSSRGTALFEYPYPVLPILYLPVSLGLGHSTLASVYVSDVVSGLLEVAAFVAGYLAVQAYTRSRWTGLLGATLIGWFPLLQMEIGWGGQAQIVAYILGLLAVWVILEKAIPSLSVRPALAAGMLLLVAAFSEVYATAVIVLAVILLLVPVLWRRLLTWRGFETIIAILAPPAAVAAVLVFTDPAASNPAGGAALSSLWAYGPAYRQLWIALTYSNSLLGAIYIGALVMYVVYRVVFRARNPVETWLVPAMGVSALAIGALLTPVGNADRGLYPLVFPFAFAVAEMATIWPPGPVPDVPRARRRWRLSQEEVSWTFPVFVVATLAITGVQIGADFQIYPNALAYYTFDPGDLSELFWLANEPGAVLYDSAPTDHMFAVLWAMNRPIYPGPSFQPYTVTSQAKQDAVVLATALSYGENWIDDGQYIVTDAESGWGQPAPGILLVKDAHTFLSIESDDFLNVVSYSPGTNPSQTTTTNLYSAASVETSEAGGGLATNYTLAGFTLNRTLAVSPEGTIFWNYSFDFSTAIPRGATLYITDSTQTPTTGVLGSTSTCCSNATLQERFAANPAPAIDQNYTVSARSTGFTMVSQYVASDQYGIFELVYHLTPLTSLLRTFSVDFAITPGGAPQGQPTVHTEAGILASTGIRWAVLSRSLGQLILQRFMDDPLYALYETTPHYYVLSVV